MRTDPTELRTEVITARARVAACNVPDSQGATRHVGASGTGVDGIGAYNAGASDVSAALQRHCVGWLVGGGVCLSVVEGGGGVALRAHVHTCRPAHAPHGPLPSPTPFPPPLDPFLALSRPSVSGNTRFHCRGGTVCPNHTLNSQMDPLGFGSLLGEIRGERTQYLRCKVDGEVRCRWFLGTKSTGPLHSALQARLHHRI